MANEFKYTKEICIFSKRVLGYFIFYDPSHPLAYSSGWVYLHRHLASQKLGKWLTTNDVVHHKNKNKIDNRLENLEIITAAEHIRVHRTGSKEPIYRIVCNVCGKPTNNQKYCSLKCMGLAYRKIKYRPSKEELAIDINTYSWCALGRKYGVSDNAVRKWAKIYGLV